ncbi:16S rRNA (cytidine(1402)-2'-O)-methyltransferase [Methylophilaceae bacterium]|nr:16S rRNA (cytidine(1402)-2'-O)-methyltransferase [Methylophilaceae bacterium]
MKATLYLIATPIGNLQDISLRAIDTLKNVDLIACEDTRHTGQLLAHFSIKKKLTSLHQHNEKEKTKFILETIRGGGSVAYVSDAGTPAISDPGAFLVNQAHLDNLHIVPIPGPSALTTAFSVAGISSNQFQFIGFLPSSQGKCKKTLQDIFNMNMTTIFYESPRRVVKTLAAIIDIFGSEKEVVIGRELTKLFETIYKDKAISLFDKISQNPNDQKGEFVIILSRTEKNSLAHSDISDEHVLKILLNELPLNQAVKLTATILKKKKKEVYNQALEIKNEK